MSPENEKRLFDAYPMLYRGAELGPQKNLMCFGFECADGWYELIDELSRQICELSPMTMAFQVKEKYGTLRFYVDTAVGVVLDVIQDFEECSGKICEECGEPGKIRAGGWVKTLCDKCCETKGYDTLCQSSENDLP